KYHVCRASTVPLDFKMSGMPVSPVPLDSRVSCCMPMSLLHLPNQSANVLYCLQKINVRGEMAMKIHFLGTGAAEGIPNPHCTCDVCEQTRIERGKNIRSRTSVIIDDELKVVEPPDTYYHTIRDRLDLTGLRD